MKLIVVDDEALARERLLRLVHKLRPQAQCWPAASGEQALALVDEHDPDLLLLDIRMPGMDGLELAARLGARKEPPAVIFCTAYDEYALRALQQQAAAYLLKPVRELELEQALAVAGRLNRVQLAALAAKAGATGDERRQLVSQTHRGVETMAVAAVRYLLAEQKYVTACSTDAQLLLPETLKELEREFGGRFVRVHRNALVAREHIQRLVREEDGRWYVVLDGVEHRPQVSRRHLAQVKQRLTGE